MKQQRIAFSLHIRHPTRDLARVCQTLGYRPKIIWSKGDARQTPKGTELEGVRDGSYCSISLGRTSRIDLSTKIEASLRTLRRHKALLRRLSSSGGRISFCVGWFLDRDAGEELDWKILAALADLRTGLDMRVYVPDGKLLDTRALD